MNQGGETYVSEATLISDTAYVDSSQEKNMVTLPSLNGIFKVFSIP